ncbi:hypothetical protein [Streptomyces tubercidicus]
MEVHGATTPYEATRIDRLRIVLDLDGGIASYVGRPIPTKA